MLALIITIINVCFIIAIYSLNIWHCITMIINERRLPRQHQLEAWHQNLLKPRWSNIAREKRENISLPFQAQIMRYLYFIGILKHLLSYHFKAITFRLLINIITALFGWLFYSISQYIDIIAYHLWNNAWALNAGTILKPRISFINYFRPF